MRIKKLLALLLALLSICSLYISPALAADTPETGAVVSASRIDLEDGSYIIEEIVDTSTARATSTKTGYKNSTYYTADGTSVYTVRVTGSFEYTGTSSKATSAAATVYLNNASAVYVSKSAFCSGISAYATGTVTYSGVTLSRSVALSCSATGVLS